MAFLYAVYHSFSLLEEHKLNPNGPGGSVKRIQLVYYTKNRHIKIEISLPLEKFFFLDWLQQ